MSIPSFLARIPRPLAAGGATLALVAAGLLAPQAASAYHFTTQPLPPCLTASAPTLVALGKAVKKKSGPRGAGYYATGSNEFLSSNPSLPFTLAELSPGVWRTVSTCY